MSRRSKKAIMSNLPNKSMEDLEKELKALRKEVDEAKAPQFVEEVRKYPLMKITFLGEQHTIALRDDANTLLIFLSLISLGNQGINNLLQAAGVRLVDYQNKQFWPKVDPTPKENVH